MTARRSRRAPKAQAQNRDNQPQPGAAPAPYGLRFIFDALQPDAYRDEYGPTLADDFTNVPSALIGALRVMPEAFVPILLEAADREYPDAGSNRSVKPSENPELVALAGFWAGVAACWHAITAINGKDGAR